ncbi:MAG TPA: DUF2236 domain-containing protein, partial [Chitinophagaceae bacterium]|nr:DUF2236 domain-containing protein [Chitinophagaceae bacterium]
WAYRDVLFMLIHYSQASFELLERNMTEPEKEELFDVFNRVGERMGLKDLPVSYQEWTIKRQEHLQADLAKTHYTIDLYKQYRKHLGWMRYLILKESQKLVVPVHVKQLLQLGGPGWLRGILAIYKLSRRIKMDGFLKSLVMPAAYKKQIRELDIVPPAAGS